jgi:hypothetical protein
VTPRPPNRSPIARIDALRRWRVRPQKDVTIGSEVTALTRGLKRDQSARKKAQPVITESLPADVAVCVHAVRVARGVLTIECAHAAAAYIVSRWLDGGGEAKLLSAAKGCKRVAVRTV